MSVVGHGIDIVAVKRVDDRLSSDGDDWLLASFSTGERAIAQSDPHRTEFFAGRYAAKEAVAKALGTGISGEIAWTDIEILRDPAGLPIVHLSHGALAVGERLQVRRWLISISHNSDFAIASAIALGE